MEKHVLNLLEFQISTPTVAHFYHVYDWALQFDERTRILGEFICDMLLLNYDLLEYPPSLLASAAAFLACFTLHQGTSNAMDQKAFTNAKRLFGSWHSLDAFAKCAQHVSLSWSECRNNVSFSRFDAVNTKYDNRVEIINVRTEVPPILTTRNYEEWFYAS